MHYNNNDTSCNAGKLIVPSPHLAGSWREDENFPNLTITFSHIVKEQTVNTAIQVRVTFS